MIRRLCFLAGCGALLVFSACSPKTKATDSPETVAARTVQAELTEISGQIEASATVAVSPVPTDTSAPVATDTPTVIATVPLNPSKTPPSGITPGGSTEPTIDTTLALTRTLIGKCPAAFFVGDVGDIRDNSVVKPNQHFTKTWDVRNIGNCTWDRSYQLRYFGGGTSQHMNGPNAVNFPEIVPPNKDIFLQVELVAPDSAGIHTGVWYLYDSAGNRFGVGPDGDEPLIVRIKVVP